jgi:hypothetical protein
MFFSYIDFNTGEVKYTIKIRKELRDQLEISYF